MNRLEIRGWSKSTVASENTLRLQTLRREFVQILRSRAAISSFTNRLLSNKFDRGPHITSILCLY